jgi:hypothetical protein
MPLIEMDNHKTNERLDKIMAAIDDLNAAIATLQTTVTSVVTALGTSGTPGTNNDAQVEVDVAAINAANAALQGALAPGTVVSTPVATSTVYPAGYPAFSPDNVVPANYPAGPVSTQAYPVGSVPIAHTVVETLPKPGDPGWRQTR